MEIFYFINLKWRALVRKGLESYIRRQARSCGSNLAIEGKADIYNPQNVSFGDSVFIGEGAWIVADDRASISLGSDVTLTRGNVVAASEKIEIGDNTIIGEYTSIRDSNHGISKGVPYRDQPLVSKEVSIGKNVWIGRGCIIMMGVKIGDNSVIGANSLVNRDIPSNSIAVGTPAKVIRKI